MVKIKKDKNTSVPAIIDSSITTDLRLNAKTEEVEGSLSKELAKLKDDVQFESRVLYIGFAVIFVTVGLFIAQAWFERKASYDSLIERVDALQAQINVLNIAPTIKK